MPSAARGLTAQEMARRALVSSLVLLLLVTLALAVWKIRLVVLLFLLAVVIASAMRPGVEALRERGIPRGAGIAVHYVALAAARRRCSSSSRYRERCPKCRARFRRFPRRGTRSTTEASQSTGLKHEVLTGLERRLAELPSRDKLVEPGVEVTRGAVEVLVAIFFVFAAAAYWISERDRVEQVFVRAASQAQPRDRAEDMASSST